MASYALKMALMLVVCFLMSFASNLLAIAGDMAAMAMAIMVRAMTPGMVAFCTALNAQEKPLTAIVSHIVPASCAFGWYSFATGINHLTITAVTTTEAAASYCELSPSAERLLHFIRMLVGGANCFRLGHGGPTLERLLAN